MPPLDFSDLQDDSGMDLDSEIPLTYSQDSHSGIQLKTSFRFACFNRIQSSIRQEDAHKPWQLAVRHMGQRSTQHAASHYTSSKSSPNSIFPRQVQEIQFCHRPLRRQHNRTRLSKSQRRSMDTAGRSPALPRPSSQRTSLECLPTIQSSQTPQ